MNLSGVTHSGPCADFVPLGDRCSAARAILQVGFCLTALTSRQVPTPSVCGVFANFVVNVRRMPDKIVSREIEVAVHSYAPGCFLSQKGCGRLQAACGCRPRPGSGTTGRTLANGLQISITVRSPTTSKGRMENGRRNPVSSTCPALCLGKGDCSGIFHHI